MENPKIKIKRYPKEIHPFIVFVRKLYKINKWIDISKLEIIFDYQKEDSVGYYDYINNKNKIYINPSLCVHRSLNTEYSESMVLVHELSHLLDNHFNIYSDWITKFEIIQLNRNSKKDRTEELAELLTVYLIDFKLFKRLNKKMYLYFRKIIKQPVKSNIKLPNSLIESVNKLIEKD